MRAVVFDIDGTLLHSNKLDDETYASAIRDVLGLGSSRFPLDGIPLAPCNDHISKVAIMAHAFGQLTAPIESITYYGDGEWDRTAAGALGWNFVPVGEKLNGLRRYG